MNSTDIANLVLDYWFGDLKSDPLAEKRKPLWFDAEAKTDNEIREKFGDYVVRAHNGDFQDLRKSAKGQLALIILLDQFTRNIYRGTPQSFESDPRALHYALDLIASGQHNKLAPIERVFLYLPLEHTEDASMQEQCAKLYNELRNEVSDEDRKIFDVFYDYAIRHQVIIDRFGRFPHRNKILGRESTPEEIEFLTQPGSSF